MGRTNASLLGALCLLLIGLIPALGGGSASAANAFPEYETVGEVPIVGHFPAKDSRQGLPPSRPWVRTTTHNLRAMGASRVRCHGLPGDLGACRVRIPLSVMARVLLSPAGKEKEFIVSCQTLRGALTIAPCFDFAVWDFNFTEQGPPLPVR